MRLPNGDHAIVDPHKLSKYTLSTDHDDGQHKARLFRSLLGITEENSQSLHSALQHAAAIADAVVGKQDKYGRRYVIDFEFAGPAGTATIRSAWIIRTGEDVPRLVTCYIL